MSELSERLWNDDVQPGSDQVSVEKYRETVLEQYKLYVEMADRVSARRNAANTYFLSLNTVLVTVIVTVAGERLSEASAWVLAAGLVILLVQCAAWFAIVRSYRLLNGAKFRVVGVLEERLPAYAYSRAEWNALGSGLDWRKYWPLSHIEQWVPIIIALTYVVSFIALSF